MPFYIIEYHLKFKIRKRSVEMTLTFFLSPLTSLFETDLQDNDVTLHECSQLASSGPDIGCRVLSSGSARLEREEFLRSLLEQPKDEDYGAPSDASSWQNETRRTLLR